MAFVDWLGMTRARMRRENEITCVVASEAIQSDMDCFVAFAPRNDGPSLALPSRAPGGGEQ